MTPTEKNLISERAEAMEKRLAERYRTVPAARNRTQACFLAGEDHYVMVTGLCFPEDTHGAIVIEHAHGKDEYDVGRFEDGDLFFMDEMSEDEMFEAMIAEIEG